MDETANWYTNNSEQQQGSWQRPVTRRFPISNMRKPRRKEYNDPCYYCTKLGHPKRECKEYTEVKSKLNREGSQKKNKKWRYYCRTTMQNMWRRRPPHAQILQGI